jgi:hypothetical protein
LLLALGLCVLFASLCLLLLWCRRRWGFGDPFYPSDAASIQSSTAAASMRSTSEQPAGEGMAVAAKLVKVPVVIVQPDRKISVAHALCSSSDDTGEQKPVR